MYPSFITWRQPSGLMMTGLMYVTKQRGERLHRGRAGHLRLFRRQSLEPKTVLIPFVIVVLAALIHAGASSCCNGFAQFGVLSLCRF